jgi:hypothetical protein
MRFLVFALAVLSFLGFPVSHAVGLLVQNASSNDTKPNRLNSQSSVQLKDLYKGSDSERRLDEQIRSYREKARQNAKSFGSRYIEAEKQKFRIPVGLRNGKAISLKYGERIGPALVENILKRALDEKSRSLKIEQGAHGIAFARDWDERFRAYDPYTGWSCQYHSNGKLAMVRHWRDGRLKGPFTQWHKTGNERLAGYYWDGWKDGLWSAWSPDGGKRFEGNYSFGQMVGKWISYDGKNNEAKPANIKNLIKQP